MKVLIVTGIYPPDIGGPATYSETLARELIKRGHEVTVITYFFKFKKQKSKCKMTLQNLKLVRISRRWPLPMRYTFYALSLLLYGRNANLVYLQDSVSAGLPTAIANLILRKPLVLKVVGDYAWEQSQVKNQESRIKNQGLDEFLKIKPEGKTRILWEIERWVARRANLIITPSNYLKSIIMKWGISEEKIKVIFNAVELSAAVQSHSPDRETVQFHSLDYETVEKMTIVSAGRLVPWKGFDTLIEVVADLIKDKSNLELVIYGDGPERKNLELRIKNYGLGNNVKLAGRVSHEELLRLLQERATIFVLNSSYEGMSHQILEAQALGVPVAVSRVGGNSEIVQDGETGLLFEYNNKEQMKQAILKLLDDKEFVTKIISQAREQVRKKHDFDIMIDATINALQNSL